MSEPSNNSNEVWTAQQLRSLFQKSADVLVVSHKFNDDINSEVILTYAVGLSDSPQIGKVILPALENIYEHHGFAEIEKSNISYSLPLIPAGQPSGEQIAEFVFQGDLLVLFPVNHALFRLDISNRPQRTPAESSTEISVKGPRDGFVEDISVNIALIRKRIRSNSLCYETMNLGRRTKTKIGLLYVDDIIDPNLVLELKKRLNKIDVDGIYSISQLEERLADYKYSLFPQIDFTGRTDYAVTGLLNGRFIIVIDGNPMVLIGPSSFSLLLKSPEDVHFNYIFVSMVRVIRAISFLLCILLPSLWVSLTSFHQDQIPFLLMASISLARFGLPLSPQLELFLLLLLLEIFREAGTRLPNPLGQTLTVAGGLVIGDASIRAGLVSPSVVVVGAITAISGATLVNQSISAAASVLRFLLFFIASILGMYGLLVGVILLIAYMSKLRSFGLPYLSPFSPPKFKEMTMALFRLPWNKINMRTGTLNPIDPDHQGEDT